MPSWLHWVVDFAAIPHHEYNDLVPYTADVHVFHWLKKIRKSFYNLISADEFILAIELICSYKPWNISTILENLKKLLMIKTFHLHHIYSFIIHERLNKHTDSLQNVSSCTFTHSLTHLLNSCIPARTYRTAIRRIGLSMPRVWVRIKKR